ncbi:carboxypeptidase regulatory-like domain-containing protein [Methyloceanibacter sp.]|uniref:carboxypeptidase regulatory-like domain-containing protein n=1 Tax=Methyloceanibacter sp. TaxID=1965321 RepID=UPI002B90AF36|nr:carboxypeptidase regulatory-like domain-containing protein [Methyloceanibacter sp.]HML93734.1 carboxypeptidase regulatory-like domain-containing protein [Methyloceanibacter sp.]
MKRLTILALILALPMTASVAKAGSSDVTGTLAMPDGKAIKGYPVVLSGRYASGSTQYWVSTTDEAGKFSFEGMPAGDYTVTPANEPDAAKSVTVEEKTGSLLDIFSPASEVSETDVGTIEVEPGDKLQSAAE